MIGLFSRAGAAAMMSRRRAAAAPSLLSQMPAGAVWFVDGTVEGTADSDGNIVATSLRDQVGSTHLAAPATESKRPRCIPVDYLVNGRKSLLLDNDTSLSAQQYLEDPTPDNALWKPIIEVEHSTGATIVVSGVMRGAGNAAMVLGNFAGGTTTPGFYIALNTTGTVNLTVWKAGANLINSTTAAGSMTAQQRFTAIMRIKPDRTWSIRVNGTPRTSGSTLTTSTAGQTITNPVTIGADSGSAGATRAFGGNICVQALWHSALSDADCEVIEDAIDAWYAIPTPVFDTGPAAGATPIAEANVAVLGTSIDVGQDALLTNGYAGEVATNIAPSWSDLVLHFVGGYRYPGSVIDTMAVGSLTVRGSATQNGFDTIADAYLYRMDNQLATMDGAGVFSSGLPLIVTCPLGWINDIKNGFAASMDRDRHGDLLRMLVRLLAGVRGYAPGLDVRFVLFTCTPTSNTVNSREITLHNASVQSVAVALRALTGRPVVVADMAALITDVATQLSDGVHPTTTVQNTVMAPVAANAIRYACGLADAA